MNRQQSIEHCIVKLVFDRPLQEFKAKDLRGAIANLYKDNNLFHQHTADRKFIYRYPLIQYKIIQGNGIIVGLGEGALTLAKTNFLNKNLYLGKECYLVREQEMAVGKRPIGVVDEIIDYYLLTPWLALNEKNSRRYYRIGNQKQKEGLLGKILIANIISLSKGVRYTIPAQLSVRFNSLKETTTGLKNTPMIGFTGAFSVNFDLPDYLGIGKSVSRGFGTIKKIYRD